MEKLRSKIIEMLYDENARLNQSIEHFADDVIEAIEEFEPRISSQKYAKWGNTGIKNVYGGIQIECSDCGDKVLVSKEIYDNLYEYERFCRHCGARMQND